MQVFGAEMAYGVGTKGLDESLRFLKEAHPELQFPLLPIDNSYINEMNHGNLKRLRGVLEANRQIRDASLAIFDKGETPLFVGGDHSAAIGTVAASVMRFPGEGLIWVDAHPDIHTPDSTESGNIHGMPVAVSLGHGAAELLSLFEGGFIRKEHVVMLGLRDIDQGEAIHLRDWGIRYYTYDHIKEMGLGQVLQESLNYLQEANVNGVHISVDIDSMNPELMPGVSVPVRDGFKPAEVEQILAELFTNFAVRALDVVEFNHLLDKAHLTEEWLLNFIKQYSRRA